MMFGAILKDNFLLDPTVIYLNNGSFGATPKYVLDAQSAWRERLERQPVHFMDRVLPEAQREALADVGSLVGASASNLVFLNNATSAVCSVLRSMKLHAADELLVISHVYGAVLRSAEFVTDRAGAKVIEVEIPCPAPDDESIIAAVMAAVTPNTRLAIIDHIASPSALVMPVAPLTAALQAAGVLVLIDGAHAPGQLDLSIEQLGADWYTGNLHKWSFTPKGCAFLYASPKVQPETHPLAISHGHPDGYIAAFDWTGTHDPSAWLAVSDALDYGESIGGFDAIRAHNNHLCATAGRVLSESWQMPIATPHTTQCHMIAIKHPASLHGTKEEAFALYEVLVKAGFEVPVNALDGACWVRISSQVFNTIDEYQALANAVRDLHL